MSLSGLAMSHLTLRRPWPYPAAPAVLAAFTVLMSLSCRSGSKGKPAGPFPLSNEVPGWSVSGEVRTFQADNLWEYIDGDADRYVQAGVEKTFALSYLYQGRTEAQADIYVMNSPEGARRILEAEPSEGSQQVQLGAEARLFPGSLVFREGRYLVRLTAFQETPGVGEALVNLGRGIGRKLVTQ